MIGRYTFARIIRVPVALPYVVFLFFLYGCDASQTARAPSSKLSVWEIGTIERVAPSLNAASNAVKRINSAISKATAAKKKRNFGIADSHYRQANTIIYQWRDAIFRGRKAYRAKKLPVMVWPGSMKSIQLAFRQLYDLEYRLPAKGKLSTAQLNLILNAMRKVVAEDITFSNSVKRRSRSPDLTKPKVTLTFEVRPFPFKLEILHGEFKIKQTASIGKLSTELGLVNNGSRAGITTLQIVNKGYYRVYAVGNRKLSFSVPASRIDINGSQMIITALQ